MKQIAEYSEFESQINEYKNIADFVPEVSTDEGYKHSLDIAKKGKTLANRIDKTRKKIKQAPWDLCKQIDAEAKVFKENVFKYSDPHAEAIEKEDDRREEERLRIHRAQTRRIEEMITAMHESSFVDGLTLDEMLVRRLELDAKEISEGEYTFSTGQALSVKTQALLSIDRSIKSKREEIERLKQEAAERERLAKEAAELAKKQEAFEAEQKAAEAKRKKEQAAQAKKRKADEAAAEKKRQAEAAESEKQRKIEAEKQAKIDAENARIAAKQKAMQDKLDAENKRIADEKKAAAAKIEQEQADKEEAERKAALAPDKEKLLSYFDQLRLVAEPVIEDSQCDRINSKFQKMLAAAVDAAESIK